jgi:hypothetical protein
MRPLSSAVQTTHAGKYYLKERRQRSSDIYKKIVVRSVELDAQQRVVELCLQENMQDEATKVYWCWRAVGTTAVCRGRML